MHYGRVGVRQQHAKLPAVVQSTAVQPVKRKPTTNKPASCSTEKSCITCEHECVDWSSITTIIEHDGEVLAHLEEKNLSII